MLEESSLGEPFGKASSANTTFAPSRFVAITNRNPCMVEGWLRHPSEAWPYEALKGGVAQATCEEKKKLGEAKSQMITNEVVFF